MKYLPFLAAILLFIGILDLPIGYYTLLRIVVCLIGVLFVIFEYDREEKVSFICVLLGIIALLFNPIIPIYLQDKSIWSVVDFFTGCIFVFEGIRFLKLQHENE